MTFRARLLAASLLTLAVGLGALVLLGNVLLATRVTREATNLLRARADAQLAALDVRAAGITVRDPVDDARLAQQAWVVTRDGRVLARPANVAPAIDRAVVALARRGVATEREVANDVRARVVPVLTPRTGTRVGAVVAVLSVGPLERLQKEVLLGSAVVAGLVLVAGWFTIRRALEGALQPVAQMTRSAASWGAHDLDRRFDLGPPRDEITGLAATLDGLLARIAASRRHEQRFAAEVAHELRTPVAGLRARAELALADEDELERTAALEAVVAQAARLDATIDALLAVARHEFDAAAGSVDLRALAAELEAVEVRAPEDLPRAEGETEVVRRALAPLVDNARRHARSRVAVVLTHDDRHVRAAVHDDGPGFDPALGDRVFEPGVRGASEGGAGLGLPLARRLAESCGGRVVLGEGPGGCAVLELPVLRQD